MNGFQLINTKRFPALTLADQVLKGVGQIMLQENALTGFLFLAGIFVGSVNMGLAAILATAVATLFARLVKYNTDAINQGLYGFNAALVGVAVLLLLKPTIWAWLLVVIGSIISTLLQQFFYTRKIGVFTLPFVLATWLIYYWAKGFMPSLLVVSSGAASVLHADYLYFSVRGFGQVIFQGHIISGILFFVAVFIHSPVAALYGLVGATLSGLVALGVGMPAASIGMGLFGYNAVLAAIVFAGVGLKEGFWGTVAVLLSLVIAVVMFKQNFLQLTFPFVAATFITLLVRDKIWIRLKSEE